MDNTEATNLNLASNNTEEKGGEWSQKNLEIINVRRNSFIDICQSPLIWLLLIFIGIIPSKFTL